MNQDSSAPVAPAAEKAPRFSVVVLTYNREAFLRESLDSILSQEGDDFELMVIDDGSTDGTPALLEGYGTRIRMIRQPHAGNTAGGRTAYHQSRGEWLIFVDSDDRLRPGALAALRQAADAHGDAAIILGRVCTLDAAGRRNVSPPAALSADRLANFRAFASGSFAR